MREREKSFTGEGGKMRNTILHSKKNQREREMGRLGIEKVSGKEKEEEKKMKGRKSSTTTGGGGIQTTLPVGVLGTQQQPQQQSREITGGEGGTGNQKMMMMRSRTLERLEQENYTDPTGPMRRGAVDSVTVSELIATAAVQEEEEGEEDEIEEDGARVKRKRRKMTMKKKAAAAAASAAMEARTCAGLGPRSFWKAMEESGATTGQVPTWASSTAEAAKRPRRWFCGMCGNAGIYRCGLCGTRFCSAKCNETHKETRCLKSVR